MDGRKAVLQGGIVRRGMYTFKRVKALLYQMHSMIYTHVLNKGGRGVLSPLDRTG